ncbi:MAG: VTT domain-containing protein [Pseudomonadota bacterium]
MREFPLVQKHAMYARILAWGLVLVCLLLFGLVLLHNSILDAGFEGISDLISSRDKVRYFISSFGPLAPLAFIGVQVMQVIVSPIPGEATGFMGGYLFGAIPGFLYSTVGLTLGSWLAFSISRLFSPYMARRLTGSKTYNKLNFVVQREGLLIAFLLFLLPGFPKDYLCYLLGLSVMPTSAFMIISTIGRMPGTLMLVLQGSKVFEQQYSGFFILMGISFIIAIPSYIFRERIISWLSRNSGKKNAGTKS